MKLSVIIPVYNEEKTIDILISIIKGVDLKEVKKEIIVVDDGSKDKTVEKLKRIGGVKLLLHKKNIGKGAAIRTGIKHVTGNIVIVQDADLEYNPNEYYRLIKPIIEGKASVVYGSRRLKKENKKHSAFSFYFGGICLTLLANLLYGIRITDEPTCYKVFRTDILKGINLKCNRFEFCPEVTAKIAKKGIKIHEVPISYSPRSIKQGKKIKWRDGIKGAWILLKYRFFD